MRNKIKKSLLAFVVLAIILVPSCFAATVLEDAEDYTEGAIIYGSTRFDTDVIITAGEAFNAGINESKVWVALGNKLNDLEPVTPYFYDGASWYKIVNDEENPAVPVTESEAIKAIEEDLHIFFVNNEMKTVEVPYDGNVDGGSVTDGAKYDKTNKKFVVPALSFNFEFTNDGAKVEVRTNVDTNKKEENTGDDIKEPEIINSEVAAIGDVKYEDLSKAIEAAKDGDTVKLLANIDIPTGIEVSKKITVNLNGKTLTAKKDTEGIGIFMVVTGGDLTIEGDGKIDSACLTNDYSMAIWVKETGKLTINGGTFTNVGAKDMEDDGKTANNNEVIYVRDNGSAVINGGTFIGNTSNKTYGAGFTLNLRDADRATASMTVKGGTFTGFNPANNAAENAGTNFVAEGYRSIYDEATNTYTVKAYDVNNVDDDDSLIYALAHAKEGDTINLAAGNYSKLLIDHRKNVAKNLTLVGVEGVKIAGVNMNGANYGFAPEGLTFKNITFTDDVNVNNTDKWGVCKNLSIIGCTFTNAYFGAGNNSTFDGLKIENNKFNGTTTTNKTSILLQGEHTNVLVKGNIIDGSVHNGVQLAGIPGKATIEGNTIKNTGSRAIRISTVDGATLTISNNIISNVNTNPTEAAQNNGEVIKITGTVTSPTAEGNTYNGKALSFVDGIAVAPVEE